MLSQAALPPVSSLRGGEMPQSLCFYCPWGMEPVGQPCTHRPAGPSHWSSLQENLLPETDSSAAPPLRSPPTPNIPSGHGLSLLTVNIKYV